MFNFFKKKNTTDDTIIRQLPVTTDIHSHILPGIDDGSPDIETSLLLLKGMYDLGIRKTVVTPHIISDMYRNTPDTISAALNKLQEAYKTAPYQIEISAAAEYMMDDHFIKQLRSGTPFLAIHKNLILTEQSYATPTSNLNEISFELITAGYRPIMAHPERYAFYHGKYDEYSRLKDLGFLLQLNLLSLTGYYGKPVTRAAKYMLQNGLVDLVGSDLHHERHLATLQNPESIAVFNEYLADKAYNDLSLF